MANTRNNGADIREENSTKVEECIELCKSEPLCWSATFLKDEEKCLLKNTKDKNSLQADSTASTWIKGCAGMSV